MRFTTLTAICDLLDVTPAQTFRLAAAGEENHTPN
ncbi:MAG: hypothetical protein ACTHWA_00510 [Arachnia sp.]